MRVSVTPAALRDDLSASRARTNALWESLDEQQLTLPYLPIVNPVLWEVGHVAWFQEYWILRHLAGRETLLPRCDELYNSATVAHRSRWGLPLPNRKATREYLDRAFDSVLEAAGLENDPYFFFLALFHEDMHAEAMTYTRQTVGLGPPPIVPERVMTVANCAADEIYAGGMDVRIGALPEDVFFFDNEKWSYPIHVPAFFIDSAPVTNRQLAEFVESRGYEESRYWSDEGWSWRSNANAGHPVYWRRRPHGDWEARLFDRWQPLEPDAPAVHVNAYEAEAWCRWAGRRLPTEVEWEAAARSRDGLANIGLVWEWTSSRFLPYPGFLADPYKEYSEPWFATPHRVLRGGSWITPSRLMRPGFRNFYEPHRRDIYAGFRSCARPPILDSSNRAHLSRSETDFRRQS